MRTRHVVAFLVAGLLGACSAPPQPSSEGITVGSTVQVSAEHPNTEHVEVVADGDPVHPGHIIACSMFQTRPVEHIHTITYVSLDGGKTWAAKVFAPEGSWDPDCHVTADGNMYFASDAGQNTAWLKAPEKTRDKLTYIEVWKSIDGGVHFAGPLKFARGIAGDREWIAIDDSPQSRYRGRMYAWFFSKATFHKNEVGGMPMENGLMRSLDGGKTWSKPVPMRFRANDDFLAHGVVLSDGTLVLFEVRVAKQSAGQDMDRTQHVPDATLYAILSRDGGASVTPPIKIADVRIAQAVGTRTVPTIAVDRSNGPFKGRLYVTWADETTGRTVIMASHSTDGAKTWATPVTVSDDFWNQDNEKGPDDFMPTAAVNNAGVVGVMWYDRRNDPDDVGYDVRFSASRDGGDTWAPSVAIPNAHNEFEGTEFPVFWPDLSDAGKTQDTSTIKLQEGTWYIGGHTAGIAATADGVFHPVWVDNRTRVQQLYSAPITVDGAAITNGDPQLAALTDRSKQLHLDSQRASYDRMSGIISVPVRIQNVSHKAIPMPIVLRAIDWRSDIGQPVAANADNNRETTGAYWRFGSGSASLPPQSYTNWRTLTFRVSNPQSLHRDHQFYVTYLTISSRLLAR